MRPRSADNPGSGGILNYFPSQADFHWRVMYGETEVDSGPRLRAGAISYSVDLPDPGMYAIEVRVTARSVLPEPGHLWAVGASDKIAFAGPDSTLAEHWNGKRWSIVPTP